MNKLYTVLGAMLLLMSLGACREESDTLLAYDQNEKLVFGAAEKSFAAKFQVLWNGMNQYYALWDFEKEEGVDWDAIYDEYYPQFQALDQKTTVTDAEVLALMKKVFDPLHDGHLTFMMTNHTLGTQVTCLPGYDRVEQRPDYAQSDCKPNLLYYANVANGEIETDEGGNPIVMEHSTEINNLFQTFAQTPGQGNLWIKDKIQELQDKSSRTDFEEFQLQQLSDLRAALIKAITTLPAGAFVNVYNSLQLQYSFLNVPGFNHIDTAFLGNDGISIKFALLKGNIAYLYISRFYLTSYLEDEACQAIFDMSNPDTYQHVQAMKQVWQTWFNTVQQLHKDGTLGGVILDLRGNGGGNMNDSKYMVGSMMPSGQIHFGYQRFKRGTGRYDYSPLMPAYVDAMSDPHETITEPIVILANCQSVSMSESSTLCLKTLPNGTFIGKPTFGAICPLTGNEEHSYTYAGLIGVEGGVTPVFGHVPSMASYTLDKKLIESRGIAPDIDIDLDITQFQSTGKDTQLDRALQFIRNGGVK